MKSSRLFLSALLVLALPFGLAQAAEKAPKTEAKKDAKKGAKKGNAGARGFNLPKADTISKKLGEKLALTDKQKEEVTKLRDGIKAKFVEVNAKKDVVAAKEALKKAGKDAAAKKVARAELKKAKGDFSASAEYKTGLKTVLNEKQFEAFYAAKKKTAKKKDAKDKKAGMGKSKKNG